MLLVCIGSHLKSVLKHKCLGLDAYHPATQYLCEQGYEDPWLFFEAKRGPREKNWETLVYPDRFICSTDISYCTGYRPVLHLVQEICSLC
jgi:hypothetical protein